MSVGREPSNRQITGVWIVALAVIACAMLVTGCHPGGFTDDAYSNSIECRDATGAVMYQATGVLVITDGGGFQVRHLDNRKPDTVSGACIVKGTGQ